MASQYATVPVPKVGRSAFDLSHSRIQDVDFNIIYPVLCEDVIPGDVFRIGVSAVARLMPMITPQMTPIKLRFETFFVPYRILFPCDERDIIPVLFRGTGWQKFITHGFDGLDASALPWIRPNHLMPTGTQADTLWDFFGFPPDFSRAGYMAMDASSVGNKSCPLAFPWLAYHCIFFNYYFNEQLIDELNLNAPTLGSYRDIWFHEDGTFDGLKAYSISANFFDFNLCHVRHKYKDYFTSALPWQQRGVSPSMPISGQIPILLRNQQSPGDPIVMPVFGTDPYTYPATSASITANVSQPANELYNIRSQVAFPSDPVGLAAAIDPSYQIAGDVDLSQGASTFDMADLRTAVQLQRWMERNARTGVRYTEFLRAHFNVAPRDERLDRPEFIGSYSAPVVISEVLQTSSSDSTSPQANMSGHGISALGSNLGTYHVKEHGIIMTLMTMMPDQFYEDCMPREWMRRTVFDYPFPEFAHLSERPVYKGELRWNVEVNGLNRETFGFQGMYDEMRSRRNVVCGKMRRSHSQNLSHWLISRHYPLGSDVQWNQNFIWENPNDSSTSSYAKAVFAVPSQPAAVVHIKNHVKAVRPIPSVATPGYLDHF